MMRSKTLETKAENKDIGQYFEAADVSPAASSWNSTLSK